MWHECAASGCDPSDCMWYASEDDVDVDLMRLDHAASVAWKETRDKLREEGLAELRKAEEQQQQQQEESNYRYDYDYDYESERKRGSKTMAENGGGGDNVSSSDRSIAVSSVVRCKRLLTRDKAFGGYGLLMDDAARLVSFPVS